MRGKSIKRGWLAAAGALALACAGMGWAATAAAPAGAAAPRALRVAFDSNYPPYLFVDAHGRVAGYEADMWRLYARHTGIQVHFMPMPWEAARQALASGQADVLDMVTRTPQREALYDFSKPYLTLPVGIYVDRRLYGIRDVGALRGLRVGGESGDACSEWLQAHGQASLRLYPTYADVVQAAVDGQVQVFCMDDNPAYYFLYRASALDRYYRAFTLFTGQLHRAVRKGDAAHLAEVEHGMALVTAAEKASLRKRWLEQAIVDSPYRHLWHVALWGVLALLAGLLLLALWTRTLKRGVAARTRELHERGVRLRALFDASPDAIAVKDRDGSYLDCNEALCRLIGVPRERLLGHSMREVMGFKQAEGYQETDDEVLRSGQMCTYRGTYEPAPGELRQLETVKVPLRSPDGAIHGLFSSTRDITERLRSEEQLQLWERTFQYATFALAVFDVRKRCLVMANPAFARERGYTPQEMAGMPSEAMHPPEDQASLRHIRAQFAIRDHILVEAEHVTRDGRRFPVQLDCSLSRDADGQPLYVAVHAQDISARRHAESELRLAAAAFETPQALLVTDAEGRIQRINQAFVELSGYAVEELSGRKPDMLSSRYHDQLTAAQIIECARTDGCWQGERWIRTKAGQPKLVRVLLSAVRDAHGAIDHLIYAATDLTSEREARASLDHMEYFDALTDLPNRHYLHRRLVQVLDGGDQRGGALLLIDLDRFKQVNELNGHAVGDRLLAMVAQRIGGLLQAGWVLGRFAGGTFAMLLEGGDDAARSEQARACAEQVLQLLHPPFSLDQTTQVAVTVSIGWTELVPGQSTPESALKEAELAMYGAKQAGRDRACWFEPSMLAALERRELLIRELREAIANEQLEPYLQAQVRRDGHIVGAEVLLRWTRADGEKVSPGVFIPLAEATGLILPLGEWVLRRSCELLVGWAAHPRLGQLALAVNVSAPQFVQPDFVDGVLHVLRETGAPAAKLKLEITESVVLGELDEAAFKLARLREAGLRISLDDFGTGYSSLSYLSRLPLDQLKIDQSFVARLPDEANDAMVAQTIVAMGHGLGLEVIAEGVETLLQRDFLASQGCDAFQGYLYAKPMPVAAFEAMLSDAVRV